MAASSPVAVIIGLEVRQRIRSTRWKWTALALFALMSAIVFCSLYLTTRSGGTCAMWSRELLAIILGTILFIGIIGAPAISAASINGDRRDATLALVQATPITGLQLAFGKWIGSWIASLTFLVIASPYLIWGIVAAASSVAFSIVAIIVTAALLGAYCAIGLGFSALSSRPTASTMLTLATILLLLIGLPAIFGITMPSTAEKHTVLSGEYQSISDGSETDAAGDEYPRYRTECVNRPVEREFFETQSTWWLLAPNPYLIVADTLAAGTEAGRYRDVSLPVGIAAWTSSARSGQYIGASLCEGYASYADRARDFESRYIGRNWYLGLAATVVLGLLGFLIAARRLRVPAARLPKGVRVA